MLLPFKRQKKSLIPLVDSRFLLNYNFHIATMQILNQIRLTRGAQTSLFIIRYDQYNMVRGRRSAIFLGHKSGLTTKSKDYENNTIRSPKADSNKATSNGKGKFSEPGSACWLSWTLSNLDW
jgi:hypothetical protein